MKELEKWSKVSEEAVSIECFIDFLNSEGLTIVRESLPFYSMSIREIRELIYKHLNIDSKKLEEERKKLLGGLNG